MAAAAGTVVTDAAVVAHVGEPQRMNPSLNKRQKERERQERQRAKAEKKKARREEKAARVPGTEGEDPDIAGIVPGPQPPAEE